MELIVGGRREHLSRFSFDATAATAFGVAAGTAGATSISRTSTVRATGAIEVVSGAISARHVHVIIFVVMIVVRVSVEVEIVLGTFSFGDAIVLGVSEKEQIYVGGTKLGELSIVSKDNDSDLRVGQDSKLVRLFEQASLTLEIGDGSIAVLLDGLDLDLFATHAVVRARVFQFPTGFGGSCMMAP